MRRCKDLMFGLALLVLSVASGCTGIPTQSAVDAAGPQISRIEWLWWLFTWVLAAVYVIVGGIIVFALWRRRREKDMAPTLSHPEPRKITAVGVATVATVLILLALLTVSATVSKRLWTQTHANTIELMIVGHQWWWEVRYLDPVPSNIAVTANEIHIPVGRPVRVRLTSSDVIHSFWVPNFHGKKDLIPGQRSETWIQANKPGIYRGQCAEFCGHQHAHMTLHVVAESEKEFQAWINQQRKPAAEPADETQARGQQVFLNGPCGTCHTVRGTPAGSLVGPDLTHVASRGTLAAGTIPNTRGHLAGWILDPQSIKPGVRMPPNPMETDELQALLTYLESLK
ncbi:MAG TPA: cytochrome c oxidase subunit II [Terriglobales bacterium]|nr:cytochrome c oxidase subunit II [Terriglobales bacterium]